jgi:uncharacterized protein
LIRQVESVVGCLNDRNQKPRPSTLGTTENYGVKIDRQKTAHCGHSLELVNYDIRLGKMKQIILAILFASFFLISARAASFDCEKTSTNIEKLVCSDIVLSKLDETLSTLYQQSIEQSDDKQHAIGEQKIWLRTVRNVCPDSLCLRNSYDARINVLNERLKLTAYVESSYFLDTPERSIDEMMAGCFADITCSAQAEVFVPAYSKASNIPEAYLRATLRDCLATQGSMNECVGYEQYGYIFNVPERSWAATS